MFHHLSLSLSISLTRPTTTTMRCTAAGKSQQQRRILEILIQSIQSKVTENNIH
ncbi:hypothetical protein MTR_8g086810 [Medicago truncatula]|uniref:Uncharacterized protein n=1 Tax=Medicago truncatula TaxID=3880 RepID=G7LJH6_MEDTR|nr:hypothetical protein MTR_8g086810 [Medicago truncatula]